MAAGRGTLQLRAWGRLWLGRGAMGSRDVMGVGGLGVSGHQPRGVMRSRGRASVLAAERPAAERRVKGRRATPRGPVAPQAPRRRNRWSWPHGPCARRCRTAGHAKGGQVGLGVVERDAARHHQRHDIIDDGAIQRRELGAEQLTHHARIGKTTVRRTTLRRHAERKIF